MTGGNGFEEAAPEEVEEVVERFEEKHGDVFRALARGHVQAQEEEMTVRDLIEKNKNGSRHRYIEIAVRDAETGRVLWDGDRRRPLPDEIGAREIVSWQEEPDPQDAEAAVMWIDVGRR